LHLPGPIAQFAQGEFLSLHEFLHRHAARSPIGDSPLPQGLLVHAENLAGSSPAGKNGVHASDTPSVPVLPPRSLRVFALLPRRRKSDRHRGSRPHEAPAWILAGPLRAPPARRHLVPRLT